MFQINGSLLVAPSFPPPGPGKPVFLGTMKALRLPARANLLPYDFGYRLHAPLLCSCSPERS